MSVTRMSARMNEREDRRYLHMAWFLIGLCTIGRILYCQLFLLTPDETNYWQWARHLALGYHDQTPLIA
jgi:undecaprenyl-diphosphatase